jgi:hypothetical protein
MGTEVNMKKEARGQIRPVAPAIAVRDALPRVRVPDGQQVVQAVFRQAGSRLVKPVFARDSRKFASDRLSFPGQNRSNKWKYTGKYRQIPASTGIKIIFFSQPASNEASAVARLPPSPGYGGTSWRDKPAFAALPPPHCYGETGRRGKSHLVKPSWSVGLMPRFVL